MSEQGFGLPSAAPRANAAVCIIGMHRSGTSITARLLNVLGLNLGPSDSLMGPSPSNPTGHFARHQRRGARALLVHPFVPLDCKLLYLGLRAREGRLARMAWWQRYREPEIIPAADF
ncbi:MAG TPA: hypothetical protein VKA79_08815 [Aestuariivirgaceae bacterium]|nr:hypothetical protein [Aestuariivirgaceae bacterium]